MSGAEVFVALGGNLGDVLATFAAGIGHLERAGIGVAAVSSAYRTAAVRLPGDDEPQPDYWNAVLRARSTLAPAELLRLLLETENRHGRERRRKWAARTLDLDLLLYGDLVLAAAGLTVPHPRLAERAFVLWPLAELAPQLVVPGVGRTAIELLRALGESSPPRSVRWLAR